MITDVEQILDMITNGKPLTEQGVLDLEKQIDAHTDKEHKATIDLAFQTQKLLNYIKEIQNTSFSTLSKEDQQNQLTSLVEEKISAFRDEIENKRNIINKLEEQELNARLQINTLSNEIKSKSLKITNLENKLGEVKDDDTHMSLKELKTQNDSLKTTLN